MQITDTIKKTWSHFINSGMTPEGAAGLMGNLFAELGIISIHVKNALPSSTQRSGQAVHGCDLYHIYG